MDDALGSAENYANSRPVAKISHLGVGFLLVRQKRGGRPLRKYTALVTADDRIPVATTTSSGYVLTADNVRSRLDRTFFTADQLEAAVQEIRVRVLEARKAEGRTP